METGPGKKPVAGFFAGTQKIHIPVGECLHSPDPKGVYWQ